ncbi:hypothetical protein DUNSADRAFT_12925 [Dunaliella salina]|uniref:Encoded protein n=1 Tax=Dunaliella salina TaxID=3046 RepID=A0ABQ7GAF7_DUNSA|nr:hypothetical protein DUNSADRAFT_12925 [Dunaliella salina]|eukprot:KAF5831591.1 hypothetical protein DUNSADRAFT_12925 [Dunaliella salina]
MGYLFIRPSPQSYWLYNNLCPVRNFWSSRRRFITAQPTGSPDRELWAFITDIMRKNRAALMPRRTRARLLQHDQGTQLLNLGDDLFGKIYASLEDREDKRALRHSCPSFYRSPAVNFHIYLADFAMDGVYTAEDAVYFLAAFPVHASMKTVKFSGVDLKSLTQYALGCADYSAAARKRCCNVDEVILEASKVPDGGDAALLSLLYPKMTSLILRWCSLPLSFLGILSTQAGRLQALQLVNCQLLGSLEGLMPVLGAFTCLESLTLHFAGQRLELDCTKLCELQRLQELSLSNVHLNHFDVLLPALSSLHHLRLSRAQLPAGIHLASETLQTLYVDTLSPTLPELSLSSFPALQDVDFLNFDLGAGLDDIDDAQKVLKVAHFARWLVTMPIRAGDIYDYRMKGRLSWSGDLCSLVLEAFSPFLEKFTAAPRSLKLTDWNFSGLTVMIKLWSYLHNVKSLFGRMQVGGRSTPWRIPGGC